MTTEETDYVTAEEYNRVCADYWRVVRESEGFDIEAIEIPPYMGGTITGLISFDCENGRYRGLVKHYGKLGLHRYNMLMETNYELASLIKFNSTQNCVCSYYITLLAHDPAVRSSRKTFQVRIDEKSYARMNFVCSIARVKETKDEATSKELFVPHFHGGPKAKIPFKGELPHWPSDADLSDGKRFYIVKKAEWEMTDWIPMYDRVKTPIAQNASAAAVWRPKDNTKSLGSTCLKPNKDPSLQQPNKNTTLQLQRSPATKKEEDKVKEAAQQLPQKQKASCLSQGLELTNTFGVLDNDVES